MARFRSSLKRFQPFQPSSRELVYAITRFRCSFAFNAAGCTMPHLKAHDCPSQYPYHSSSHLLGAGYASLHVLCDLLIALSYFLIFFALLYFVRQRRDLPFHRTFLILGVFIIACGTGYLIDIGIPSGADNWRT